MKLKYRKGIFLVAYSNENEKIKYLVLKRKLHWKGWEFPKGGIENNENLISTAKRELKEETGKNSIKIKKFNAKGKYKFNKKFNDELKDISGQTFEALFAIKIRKKGKIKLDKREHSGYKWLVFKEAIKKLTWPNQKKCLRIVNEWLNEGN